MELLFQALILVLVISFCLRWWLHDLAGMKFCLVLSGSRQCYKFFINYILRLDVKCSILFQSLHCAAGTKFCHVIASARLSGMKKLINTSVWNNLLRYISIDCSYFYCFFTTHMTSVCDKKVNQCLYRISSFREHFLNQWESMGFHKQIPDGNLSRPAAMKIHFSM